MNKATNIHSISFYPTKNESTKYDKTSQSLVLKINVALNVNLFENLKCKIVYKEGNEIKSIVSEIINFKNNIIYLDNSANIELNNLIDIKF